MHPFGSQGRDPADTQKLVEAEGISITLEQRCAPKLLFLTSEVFGDMRAYVERIFAEAFAAQVIQHQYTDVLNGF